MVNKNKTFNMALSAIFIALLLLESFVPNIGYITIIPGLPAITTIPLTIAVYACLSGAKAGAGLGLLWGLTSLLRAYVAPNGLVTILLFQNPVIAILPRMLAGFFAGLIGKRFDNKFKAESARVTGYTLSGLVASITNTLVVIILSWLFYANNSHALLKALGQTNNTNPLLLILLVSLGANGIAEALFSGIVTPLIVTPLKHRLKRR